MPQKLLRSKSVPLPSSTIYAVRKGRKWYSGGNQRPWGTFASAMLFRTRPPEGVFREDGVEVVPCRVRVLPSARKAPHRTRCRTGPRRSA